MGNLIPIPALSEDGWVFDSIKLADYLLSHFFVSDYSQSYIYNKHVASLPWIILDTQGDITRTITVTRETLSTYFSRYFKNVIVEVMEVPNEAEPSKGQISIYVRFTDSENKEFVLGRLIKIANTTIEKIITLSNG